MSATPPPPPPPPLLLPPSSLLQYAKSHVVKKVPREMRDAAAKRREEDHSSNQKSTDNPEEISIDTDWLWSIATETLRASKEHQKEKTHTIFWVPEDIRQHDEDAYEPMVVKLGPYHRAARAGSRSPMEEYKRRCVQKLIARREPKFEPDLLDINNEPEHLGGPDLLKKCLQALMASEAAIRSSYSDTEWNQVKSMGSIELAKLMLLDGCFILHRLLGHNKKVAEEYQCFGELYLSPALGRLWIWDLVNYDLLLLKNQIPFFVVTKLFDILRTEADENVDLVTQALKLFRDVHPCRMKEEEIISFSEEYGNTINKPIHHLLHLFYISIDLPPPSDELRFTKASAFEDPNPDWIPCATELQEAGITFKKAKNAPSLLDISFSKHGGVLEIPPLEIHDYSTRLFRNLIAFEQFYPDTRSRITIYVVFMSCIINGPNDMRLLHLNRILTDKTNSEEGALQFFSCLGYQIHYASERNYLGHVFREVGRYHGSTLRQWRAQLVRNYFSNPWAAISVLAAIVLFALTIAQTILSA